MYYFPRACGLKDEPIEDGNVTRAVRSYAHKPIDNTKAVHKTSVLIDASFTMLHADWLNIYKCLMPGFTVKEIPLHVAYMAHLKMHATPSHSNC